VGFRKEKDAMGEVLVPEKAYYGAQTQRAIENFPVSNIKMPVAFIRALALIKSCAAMVNCNLGLLSSQIADAIIVAADEITAGLHDKEFPVDVFQTGSGTSTNMNVNEVIAGRANEIITGRRGGKSPVHPNDHVNMGQSSNDVIPSALNIAAVTEVSDRLIPSVSLLLKRLDQKASEFSKIMKIGRTHLQDALPITLGQEFAGYEDQVKKGLVRIERAVDGLMELTVGGTAVGTGVGAKPEFAPMVIDLIAKRTGFKFKKTSCHFSAQSFQDAVVSMSAALKGFAISMMKIANDIRWLASGPRCGLGEIRLPALQPGSSIMPGKVNPVIPEVVIQVGAQVMGNDLAISLGGKNGNFELNTMLPLIIHNLLQSVEILTSSTKLLAEKCVLGIVANREKCEEMVEKSIALSTLLVPVIGYDKASEVARIALEQDKTVMEVVKEKGLLTREEYENIFGDILKTR